METVAVIITLTLLCQEIKIGYSLDTEEADSQTIKLPEECQDGWIMEELAFNHSPGKCQNYFQCWYGGNNKLNVMERSCGYNNFWSQKLLTCVRPEDSECPDPCFNATQMVGYRYGMLEICGGYWECERGKSVANCCPAKEKYDEDLHKCMPDTNLTCNNTDCGVFKPSQGGCVIRSCRWRNPEETGQSWKTSTNAHMYQLAGQTWDKYSLKTKVLSNPLFNEIKTIKNIETSYWRNEGVKYDYGYVNRATAEVIIVQVPGVIECRHTPKLDSRTEFQEVVDGTTFTLQCPPGTVYLQEICSCTFDKEYVVVTPGCKPSAYSSFDSIIPEEGIQCYGAEMIDDGEDHARSKYIYLNGSAYVNIVTLSNSYYTNTLAISFWIRSDGNFSQPQTILTNHMQIRRNCRDLKCEGSIEIRLRPNNKLFTFVVSENRKLKLLTNITFGEWNHVWLVYESEKEGVFGVKSGNSQAHVIHKGYIDQRMSGLIIGRPSITWKGDYFTGAIDEFKVYKCIPDEAKEALSFI